MNEISQIKEIIDNAVRDRVLRKIVFSKSKDKNIIKSTAALFENKNGVHFTLESFTADNKAHHTNLPLNEAADRLAELAVNDYMQTNILTASGECEVKVSKSGSIYIGNRIKKTELKIAPLSHNREKKHILDPYKGEFFLYKLGITDKNGRIHDKMQAKYRQINRFLEIVSDVSASLPNDRPVVVYDLCCGKSYLSFALYFYLERVLGLKVEMLGADLKRDVIDYCNDVAASSHMDGLKFVCGDIGELGLKDKPDMVVSLHACDIATDIVLAHAIKSGAGIILSTPCCHHELYSKADSISENARKNLGFVLSHSMSAQKLCENLTDSLRAKTLEAYGYKVDLIELVTPDDTPKNLLIRGRYTGAKKAGLDAAREYIGVELTLEKLLK
jgi:SAM-dependent methyltransferase